MPTVVTHIAAHASRRRNAGAGCSGAGEAADGLRWSRGLPGERRRVGEFRPPSALALCELAVMAGTHEHARRAGRARTIRHVDEVPAGFSVEALTRARETLDRRTVIPYVRFRRHAHRARLLPAVPHGVKSPIPASRDCQTRPRPARRQLHRIHLECASRLGFRYGGSKTLAQKVSWRNDRAARTGIWWGGKDSNLRRHSAS